MKLRFGGKAVHLRPGAILSLSQRTATVPLCGVMFTEERVKRLPLA